MGRTTFEDAMTKVDTVYRLVVLTAKRAKQLDNGSPPLVKTTEKKKVQSVSLLPQPGPPGRFR